MCGGGGGVGLVQEALLHTHSGSPESYAMALSVLDIPQISITFSTCSQQANFSAYRSPEDLIKNKDKKV